MFFWNFNFASKLARDLINLLREFKSEIKERYKMQRYYGMLRDPIAMLKIRRLGILTNTNTWSRTQDVGKIQDYAIPDELNSKLKKIRDLYRINKSNFSNPPMVTFISYTIPQLNSTAADFRLCHILKILLEKRCIINFLYCAKNRNESKYIKIFEGKINFTHLPLNFNDYVQFVAEKASQYVWITELWRLNYLNFMAKLVEELKASCPSSKLLVDTIDFHYKEFHRKFELTGNLDDLKQASAFLDNEKVLYRAADIVLVVSEEEKKDIHDKISGIKKIEILPIIHEVQCDTRPYSKREHICFVGHFGNKHNVDAVSYFLENIFHLISEKNPGVEFHVLGYSSDQYKHRFESHNVKVVGGLKYIEEALTHYRLFVCPMTYGAGMKGKIGGAVAAGIPVVTTTIGAEGFSFTNGEECFIADSPEEFAEKCNQCLEDPALWHHLSVNSRLMMAENFSPCVVAEKLKKVLSE